MNYLPTPSTLLILAATLFIIPLPAPCETLPEAGADTNSDTELIEALIAHHTAAREKIKSYHAKYTYERIMDPPPGTIVTDPQLYRDTTAEAEIIRQGDCYWFTRHSTSDVEGPHKDLMEYAVLNPKYYVEIHVPEIYKDQVITAYWVDHKGLDALDETPMARSAKYFTLPEPIVYGFTGANYGKLENTYHLNRKFSKWTVSRTNSSYVLTRDLFVHEQLRTRGIYSINSEKGYMLELVDVNHLQEDLETKIQVELEALGNGVYFPKTIGVDAEEHEFRMIDKIKVTEVEINNEYPDIQFEFGAIPVDMSRLRVKRSFVDGKLHDYRYLNGEFIPEEILKR